MKKGIGKNFQEIEEGKRVVVDINKSYPVSFPKKVNGKNGIIEEKRGKAYIVKIKEFNKPKKYIIKPVHLTRVDKLEK